MPFISSQAQWILALNLLMFLGSATRAEGPAQSPAEIPAVPDFRPGPDRSDSARQWQGISGLERTSSGRLWATWYGGGLTEDRHNYVMLVTSGDDGRTWSELKLVLDPDGSGPVRAFDPVLWIDPSGKLWLYWCHATGGGHADPFTFAMTAETADSADPEWSAPRLVHDGVMMCKPTVLADGTWLLPTAIWNREHSCRVVASADQGRSWNLIGHAGIPNPGDRNCDEPMLVQRNDGTIWQLVRTRYGIGESISTDQGKTWPDVTPWNVAHTASRFFIRRLNSGNLLLVKHGAIKQKTGRSHLMAFVSRDDGQTWEGGLLLDERDGVSYPDGAESAEGVVYLTYDYDRVGEKYIYLTTFTEADILAGKNVSGQVRLRQVINHATGINPHASKKSSGEAIKYYANADGQAVLSGQPAQVDAASTQVQPLVLDVSLFTDRNYHLRQLPPELEGKQFVRASIDGSKLHVTKDGILFVATPTPGRNGDSIEAELVANGFEKTKIPEFLLFDAADPAANVCSTYQKKVQAGETLEIPKWGVVIF